MRLLLALALLLAACTPPRSPGTVMQTPTQPEAPKPAAAPVISYVLVAADGRALALDSNGEPMAELAYCGELPGETPAIVFCADKVALGG